MRKLGSRAMEEKARIRKMDPGIFFMQVLDFYRRPMLYYYNDCKYVRKAGDVRTAGQESGKRSSHMISVQS